MLPFSTHAGSRPLRKPRLLQIFFCSSYVLLPALLASVALPQSPAKPYKITIKEVREQVVEPVLPVDPKIDIKLTSTSGMAWGLQTSDNKRLTFSSGSARTAFKIDGQRIYPGAQKQPLPPKKNSKLPRHGALYNYQFKDVHVTNIHEVVPSKLPGPPKPGQKRKMDTVLFKYVIENKGNQEVKFALRVRIDTYNWTTDGPAGWSPTTMPGKILDGTPLEGKDVPDYLIMIQHRNLQNPGHLAYFTFNQRGRWEKPTKALVTSHGAADLGWEVQAVPGNFDTDIVLFWAEKPLKPRETRIIQFGYGTGLATNPENEGRVTTHFGGSFEPKKNFTLTAQVEDPVESQSLTLLLPEGMELLEGKETQPVPPPDLDNRSVVFWKCRVLKTGTYPIRIQSSNGVTLTRTVTVEKAK